MKSEKEEFLFASTTVPEVNELDQELFENLNRFAIQLGYLNAAATTGRMSASQAEKRVKDLYKAWKSHNKSIKE